MNRIIKFRVWDKESEKMYPVDGIQFATQDIIAYDEDLAEDQILPFDSPLMQFTGLTDSKGKEIYEGDIVKFLMCSLPPVYKIGYSPEYAAFCAFDGKTPLAETGWKLTSIRPDFYEVIGNIYQNAELLEK